jgi:hypothetical protein
MPYIYRVSRRTNIERQPAKAGVTVATVNIEPAAAPPPPEPSYRDLQAQAKALDIPANQTADELRKAIAEANE